MLDALLTAGVPGRAGGEGAPRGDQEQAVHNTVVRGPLLGAWRIQRPPRARDEAPHGCHSPLPGKPFARAVSWRSLPLPSRAGSSGQL
jgi:hypothetical protein